MKRRDTYRRSQPKLRLPASIEDLDFNSPRGLDGSVILRLASPDWTRNHQVGLITRGTGKTYLACALSQAFQYSDFSSMMGGSRLDGG